MTLPIYANQQAMIETLHQGLGLLETITASDYTRKHPLAFHASIGGHYRHCLEHFEPLLYGDTSLIDYDARPRDKCVETDRERAAERTGELISMCQELTPPRLASLVQVRCRVNCSGHGSPMVSSTFEREAMYAVAHAIHHYALISVMCNLMNVTLPETFGIAPSTVVHKKDNKQWPVRGIIDGAHRQTFQTVT